MWETGSFGRLMLRISSKSIPLFIVAFFGLVLFSPFFLIYDYTLGEK